MSAKSLFYFCSQPIGYQSRISLVDRAAECLLGDVFKFLVSFHFSKYTIKYKFLKNGTNPKRPSFRRGYQLPYLHAEFQLIWTAQLAGEHDLAGSIPWGPMVNKPHPGLH